MNKSRILRFLPSGMTPLEKEWLATLLELDFDEKDTILKQLSQASVTREATKESLEIFFHDIPSSPDGHLNDGVHLFMDVYMPDRVYVEAELATYNGKLDSLYIYAPDTSDLRLPEVPLDDVKYSIDDYAVKARHLAKSLYPGSLAGFREVLSMMSVSNVPRVESMLRLILDELPGMAHLLPRDYFGPYSLGCQIDLGHVGDHEYQGIICCSLIGGFYFMYVIEDGKDHVLTRLLDLEQYRGFPGFHLVVRYPHGSRLQKARDILYHAGYKPLSDFMLDEEFDVDIDSPFNTCLLEALFLGDVSEREKTSSHRESMVGNRV